MNDLEANEHYLRMVRALSAVVTDGLLVALPEKTLGAPMLQLEKEQRAWAEGAAAGMQLHIGGWLPPVTALDIIQFIVATTLLSLKQGNENVPEGEI